MSNIQPMPLSDLTLHPYLTKTGELSEHWSGIVGAYAIFDQAQALQYVGYSRDIGVSLTQHLVRCPHQCHWLKVQPIAKPSRTLLDLITTAWIEDYGTVPPGNSSDQDRWTKPIDAKPQMTDEERSAYETSDELGRIKLLKQLARRVEAEVVAELQTRGVTLQLRFDPKLKEQGLLNLK